MTAAVMIAVAPNGARRTKADHPRLPMTAPELAREAAACRDAGAAMIHLHVRDREGRHTLDVDAYREATAAIRSAVGDDLIVQVTSEAQGLYKADAQMAMVRALRPQAVSLALRELVPDADAERAAADFFAWMAGAGVGAQYILYSADEVGRLRDLARRGVVVDAHPCALYVLGRYSPGQTSQPADLLPFLAAREADDGPWAVCAFGADECACALTAAALGGHMRVGFENNLALADGSIAADNAALVAQAARGLAIMGRRPASAAEARPWVGLG